MDVYWLSMTIYQRSMNKWWQSWQSMVTHWKTVGSLWKPIGNQRKCRFPLKIVLFGIISFEVREVNARSFTVMHGGKDPPPPTCCRISHNGFPPWTAPSRSVTNVSKMRTKTATHAFVAIHIKLCHLYMSNLYFNWTYSKADSIISQLTTIY